jgi:hypothetical protein
MTTTALTVDSQFYTAWSMVGGVTSSSAALSMTWSRELIRDSADM